ncbi:MAG: hypothetical protein HY565_06035 [Candidatus Kerfeldbacteria bacterium]|nr:hypothetical protein [Candidatus Kerfeldbacteria bacterium]
MEPRPYVTQPDQKRRRPLDSVEDEIKPGDVDEDDDRAWQDWIDDDSGLVKPPLAPLDQPEMGIHVPESEMDEEDRRRQDEKRARREQWRKDNDPDSVPRGVWEMKK